MEGSGTYLGLMNPPHINAKPRIRPPRDSQTRRIREIDIDDHDREQREEDVESEVPEADVRVPRVDLAVAVTVPEEDVLLEDRLCYRWCQLVHTFQ
jgi:hypothetical protein